MGGFRWRSWLGASVVLFLLYGAVDMQSALYVPTTLIQGGAGATAVVLDPDSDAYLVGGKQVIDTLRRTNLKLDTLLVSSMVSMCAQMMAFAIVAILVTWFAIRSGQAWALWHWFQVKVRGPLSRTSFEGKMQARERQYGSGVLKIHAKSGPHRAPNAAIFARSPAKSLPISALTSHPLP